MLLENKENILSNEGFVEGSLDLGNYYVYYQESSQEYALDYSIIKKDTMSLYDGGLLVYGLFNPITKEYDIEQESPCLTYEDLINEIKDLCEFNEDDIKKCDERMTEELSYIS